MHGKESTPLLSGNVYSVVYTKWYTCWCPICRWKRMPKHIKICKHPDTKRFYVSDVTDFHSVWVSSLPVHIRHTLTCRHSPHLQELVSYYQTNSLGTSFPGVDTTLRVPYKDVVDTRARGTTNPPPLPPSRSHQPLPSPITLPEREMWAEVLFNFSSEFPDEMSIEVRQLTCTRTRACTHTHFLCILLILSLVLCPFSET